MEAALPAVVVGIAFVDLVESAFLDLLAVRAGEVGDAHDEIAWDCVETGGNHTQADRHYLSCVWSAMPW